MAGARASIRYAKAVLSLATDQKATDSVNKDMKLIVKTIAESDDLREMLQNPLVRSSVKESVLNQVFKNTNSITGSLVNILITNKRIALLENVASKYNQLYDTLKGTEIAKVTTVVPLTDALKVKVLAKVKELTGKEVEVVNIIDQSILGGFILRVGDIQYNASIANKLNKLKREFTLN
jgi:F-type H+-transporting ATPase subunit delta